MEWTKLDRYNCEVLPGIISVKLCGTNDPDLVDIMSEIDRSGGKIYLDGKRYEYLNNYKIGGIGRDSYIDLYVKQR